MIGRFTSTPNKVCSAWPRTSAMCTVAPAFTGGAARKITTRDGLLFVFDPQTKQRVCQLRPVEGANTVTSLAVHPSGLVFGTTDNRRLFAFDPERFVVEEVIGPLRSEGTRLMGVPEGVEMFPLICASDGFIYGLTRFDLFRIDGSSRVLTYLNDPPLPELYALTEGNPRCALHECRHPRHQVLAEAAALLPLSLSTR